MLSRFLPSNFDAQGTIVVIAGKGIYPCLVVERLRALKLNVRLIAFEGETAQDLIDSFPQGNASVMNVGQIGRLLKSLKTFQAKYALMVGQITPKRLFKGLNPDLKAILLLAKLKERNAATIFGALAEEIAKIGVYLLDARSFLDESLATEGLMTKGSWKLPEYVLDHGIRLAQEMARLEVGQGIVVSRGTVLAVEAFEGTNEMLRRAGTFNSETPVFIKSVNPQHDYRFDVPVIGMHTLEILNEAKIHHVAVQAFETLILEKQKVLATAQNYGIQLLGYSGKR
jgi:DUF1009 family protein